MSTELVVINGNGNFENSIVCEDDDSDQDKIVNKSSAENVPEQVLNHVTDSVISKDDHEENTTDKTDVCSRDNAVIEDNPEPPVRSHSRVSNASNHSKASSK